MNWHYKVLSIDNIMPNQDDHDIAVSKEASTKRKNKLACSFEDNLNKLGNEGWEMVTLFGDFVIFKKPNE